MDELGVVYHKPKSLYCNCIEYVASNLLLVESLVGFPEMIGREIFQAAVDFKDSFCFQTSSGRKSLQLFFDAYGDSDVLPSLSLGADYIFFNDVIDDCWWIFQHLVLLDLTSCGIGDGHDFMILIGRMLRLQTLSLRNNQVTDEGIRRLTAKTRMSQTSSLVLRNLDISSNTGITVKSVHFLRCLPSLALLNVSDTSVKFKDTVLLNDWEALTEHGDKCDCVTSHFLVRTVGWAADVLENWKTESQRSTKMSIKSDKSAESSPTVGITGQTFYSRSTVRTTVKPSTSLSSASSNSSRHESRKTNSSLILMSQTFSCPHFQPQKHLFNQSNTDNTTCTSSKIQKASVNSVRRQTIGADGCSKQEKKTQLKTREMLTDCDLDEDVLSHYRCSPPRKKLKTREMLTDCDLDEDVLSHYRCSPPRKKLKRISVLQLLNDCS